MKRQPGFSLVEILIVVGVIAVLTAILLPVLFGAVRYANRNTCKGNLHQIGIALGEYYQDNKCYPNPAHADPILTVLVRERLEGIKTCPLDRKGNNTYSEFYNYWGYARQTTPKALRSKDEAKAVYEGVVNPRTGQEDLWYAGSLDGADGPGTAFPGLINPSAKAVGNGSVIVTICKFHDGRKPYNALRISGEVDFVTPGSDAEFWMLSKSAD